VSSGASSSPIPAGWTARFYVLAAIGISPSLAHAQHQQARDCAALIGATLTEVQVDELDDRRYTTNQADRCFHCKSHLYRVLLRIAREKALAHVVCGSNLDDESDYRPGNRAADVLGVRRPLMDARLTKEDIRQLSRQLGLPTADLPASPCLASRVSYGLEITERRLKQVEEAESFLRSTGMVEFRVRHHDQIARIEVCQEDWGKVMNDSLRVRIVEKFKSIGFKYVTLDLQGFRSGSLNEMLPPYLLVGAPGVLEAKRAPWYQSSTLDRVDPAGRQCRNAWFPKPSPEGFPITLPGSRIVIAMLCRGGALSNM